MTHIYGVAIIYGVLSLLLLKDYVLNLIILLWGNFILLWDLLLQFFSGGFGTLDDFFELLILRQTGMKRIFQLFLFGKGFWEKVINFQFLSDIGFIWENDLSIF